MSTRFSHTKGRTTKTTSFRLTKGELYLLKQMSKIDRVPMRETISSLIMTAAEQRGLASPYKE